LTYWHRKLYKSINQIFAVKSRVMICNVDTLSCLYRM
jgi:hypothetical protein